MKTPRERYLTDAWFKTLVDMMVNHIAKADFTPSEMREAAMLACIIYEEQNTRRPFFSKKAATDTKAGSK